MKQSKKLNTSVSGGKIAVVFALYAMAFLISASGLYFGIYSLLNDISFKVINTNVHGAVFGLVVAYLGIRYFMSVQKLSKNVYDQTAVFSWHNFKLSKKSKPNNI